MENQEKSLDQELVGQAPAEKKRPAFLTVLCILTWVGAGFAFISAIYGLLTLDTVEDMMKMTKSFSRLTDSSPFVDEVFSFDFDPEKMRRFLLMANIFSLASALIRIPSAVAMWKLKKIGFYTYTIGHVLTIVSAYFTYLYTTSMELGGIASGMMGSMAVLTFAISIIFAVGFVVMYAVNLKHMK